MEFRCRCHGLSGSCSLKTCWLSLPNFQVIGAYLKKKYEASVHLPSAVDVNKLIPMMNRDEISAILSNQAAVSASAGAADAASPPEQQQQQPAEVSNRSQEAPPEYAALVAAAPDLQQDQQPSSRPLSGHFIVAPTSHPTQHNNLSSNRQQQQQQQLQLQSNQTGSQPSLSSESENEIPVNIAPLSQQQYQALLRDMRLCNTTTSNIQTTTGSGSGAVSHLATRDLHGQQQQQQQMESHQQQQQQQSINTKGRNPKKQNNNNQLVAGQNLRSANQHLSQLLQHSTNKDELIYLHKSPNYCEADLKHGFLGIQSRVCSENPAAPNNCDKLCCGRGYSTRIYQHSYRCDCKFQYCCSIHCSDCERETKLLVCN